MNQNLPVFEPLLAATVKPDSAELMRGDDKPTFYTLGFYHFRYLFPVKYTYFSYYCIIHNISDAEARALQELLGRYTDLAFRQDDARIKWLAIPVEVPCWRLSSYSARCERASFPVPLHNFFEFGASFYYMTDSQLLEYVATFKEIFFGKAPSCPVGIFNRKLLEITPRLLDLTKLFYRKSPNPVNYRTYPYVKKFFETPQSITDAEPYEMLCPTDTSGIRLVPCVNLFDGLPVNSVIPWLYLESSIRSIYDRYSTVDDTAGLFWFSLALNVDNIPVDEIEAFALFLREQGVVPQDDYLSTPWSIFFGRDIAEADRGRVSLCVYQHVATVEAAEVLAEDIQLLAFGAPAEQSPVAKEIAISELVPLFEKLIARMRSYAPGFSGQACRRYY
jgi:hypothetical protein